MAAAVKVTEVPWQKGLADAVMTIVAGNDEVTFIVIGLDRTGFP